MIHATDSTRPGAQPGYTFGFALSCPNRRCARRGEILYLIEGASRLRYHRRACQHTGRGACAECFEREHYECPTVDLLRLVLPGAPLRLAPPQVTCTGCGLTQRLGRRKIGSCAVCEGDENAPCLDCDELVAIVEGYTVPAHANPYSTREGWDTPAGVAHRQAAFDGPPLAVYGEGRARRPSQESRAGLGRLVGVGT